MKKVYVTREIPEAGLALLRKHFQLTVQPEDRDLSQEEFLKAIQGYDGVLTMLTNRVNEEVLAAAPSVKVFANYAVGFNNIDVDAATDHGVAILNTPDALTLATAELAWGLLFAAARHMIPSDRLTRSGGFDGWEPMGFMGMPVTGRTLGIIGAGRIGQAFGRMAKGFEMEILYNSPSPKPDFEAETGARYTDLSDLLAQSDFVAIHCPYNLSTHHLLGREQLALMKRSAVLVNTARGAIFDEEALYEALRERRIYSAGLDVYEKEPALWPGLADLENVVLTSHIGSATYESRNDMAVLAARGIMSVLLDGKAPANCLNPEVLDQ